jgi:hypothetical protein
MSENTASTPFGVRQALACAFAALAIAVNFDQATAHLTGSKYAIAAASAVLLEVGVIAGVARL